MKKRKRVKNEAEIDWLEELEKEQASANKWANIALVVSVATLICQILLITFRILS